MKIAVQFSFFLLVLLGFQFPLSGQPIVNFTLPDSSCVGDQINITNLTTGGSTFYWNFCSGNANNDPTGVNIGNPGNLLNVPTYITLVQDGNNCYSFISSQQVGVIRYYHGSSFCNYPISWTNLGTFGFLSDTIEGIQIQKENGNWYGFVCDNAKLARLNFGNSLANTPNATPLGPFFSGTTILHGLQLLQENSTWLAFANCTDGDKFVRFNFGNSLTNIPIMTNFGNFGILTSPGALRMIQESQMWYGLILDTGLVRLTFGNSLLNTPTAENLGNPGGFNTVGGLTVIRDCDTLSGYFTNYLTNGQLGKLIFSGGVGGTVTGQIIGNIGNLNRPHSFSELFRQNDTLFAYITDRGSNSLTKLTFPPCTNASIPSSTLFNPPPFSYNQTGSYNIRLLVNEGLPNQVSLCKSIVIGLGPTVNLGPDKIICPGTSTTIDAGPGFTSYLWSNGDSTRMITVSVGGAYSVIVTQSGCSATDTVIVSLSSVPVVNLGPDTTVCQGQSVTFDAGACTGCTYLWIDLTTNLTVGTSQTYSTNQAGTYKATVTNPNGCQGMDTVQLSTILLPVLTTYPLSESICSGSSTNIILTADLTNTTFSWSATGSSSFVSGYSPGTGDTINQLLTNTDSVNETVTYWITPSIGFCPGDSVAYIVTVMPFDTVKVSIKGSANKICNPIPVTFTATPTNGGTTPAYQWMVNGLATGTNAPFYSYTPSNNDVVLCVLTSNLNCSYGNPSTSNAIYETVYSIAPIDLGPDTSICQGSTITFDAGTCHDCSFYWSDLTTGQLNIGTGQTFTTGTAGIYCVIVTDSNGCINGDTIQLSYNLFSQSITGDTTPCQDSVSYLYLTEAGMSNYQWSVSQGGNIISGLGTNLLNVEWTSPGSQLISVNYVTPAGCTASIPTSFSIHVSPIPGQPGNIKGPQQHCTGVANETYSIDTIAFAQTYGWQLPPGFQIVGGQGTNTVTISVDSSVITGNIYAYGINQCGDGPLSSPFHFIVQLSPIVDAGANQSISYGTTTMLVGSISGGSGSYSFFWEPSSLLTVDTILNPKTVNLTHDTLFILTVIDLLNGCQGSDSVRIKVVKNEINEDCLVFHNVITPNGDGLNDKWIIDCIDNFPDNKVIIFNRWGEEINRFEHYDNVSQVWKGTRTDGRPLPDGTYYYLLTINNGGRYSGWIFLRGI